MTEPDRVALPLNIKQDLRYRRSDLVAALEREEARGTNSGLMHAARRAVRFMDELLEADVQ